MKTGKTAVLVGLLAVLVVSGGVNRPLPAQEDMPRAPEVPAPGNENPARAAERMHALCTRAVSGDRIEVETRGGGTLKISYLGVQLPDSEDPTPALRLLNRKARAFNRQLVENQSLMIEFESPQPDEAGRLPAYVFVGKTFVNAELIRQGYARVADSGVEFQLKDYFRKKEKQAIEEGRGIWAVQGKATLDPDPPPQTPRESLPEGKYAASTHSKVFHRSECYWAREIAPDNLLLFETRDEAMASGRRPCRVCEP